MMSSDAPPLIVVECTVKVHFTSGQVPRQHRCRLALVTWDSYPCLQLEGKGMPRRRVKLGVHNLRSVAAQRIEEGRLTIVLKDHEIDMITLSDVTNKPALKACRDLLGNIASGSFCSQSGSTPVSLQSSTRDGSSGSCQVAQSPVTVGSGRKIPRPSLRSGLSRGAKMVEAATKEKASATPAAFYKSSTSPHMSETFLPQSTSPRKGGYFRSARRSLALDLSAPNENEDTDADNFQPCQNFRVPPGQSQAFNSESSLRGILREPTPTRRFPLGELSGLKGSISSQFVVSKEEDVGGFANLGNTCYMNAVLQSLLGLEPFAHDLLNYQLVKQVHPNSLYRMMFLLLKSMRAQDSYESQRILLRKIKTAIGARASKFSGYRQQDAHELLGQCLDQLRDDVEHIQQKDGDTPEVQESLCPVVRNFECEILRTITCKSCGKVSKKGDVIYDFPLQLPKSVLLKPNEQENLQKLFELFFTSEEVEYTCTACQGKTATLSYQLSKLPRVLILFLKRYGYNTLLSKGSKRVDNIRIPRVISVGHLCAESADPPLEFERPLPSFRDAAVSFAVGEGENKENIPNLDVTPTRRETPQVHSHSLVTPLGNSSFVAQVNAPLGQESTANSSTGNSTTSNGSIPMQEQTSLNCCHSSEDPAVLSPAVNNSMTSASEDSREVKPAVKEISHHASQKENRRTILGKRRSSERSQADLDNLCCSESVEAEGRKMQRREGSSSSSVTELDSNSGMCSKAEKDVSARNDTEENAQKTLSERIVDEFDQLFASPEVVFEFDKATEILANGTGIREGIRPALLQPSLQDQELPVPVYDNPAALTVQANAEDDDLQRALEESLRAQPNDLQLLQQMGLSEEEQLRLALELSIQESSGGDEDSDPLPSPCHAVEERTPTRETNSRETYRLMSIVSHIGRGSGGGHYISDVYSVQEGVWKSFNDSQVTEFREEDIRQRRQTSGYIFFYMHKSICHSILKDHKH